MDLTEEKVSFDQMPQVVSELVDCGYDAELLVPEETDIPLRERVRRVNDKCDNYGVANVLLVSYIPHTSVN